MRSLFCSFQRQIHPMSEQMCLCLIIKYGKVMYQTKYTKSNAQEMTWVTEKQISEEK